MGNSSVSILRFSSIMVMISTYLPLVFANLPQGFKSHHIWTVLWFTSLTIFHPRVILNKYILFLIGYGTVVIFLLLNTVWDGIDPWMKNQLSGEFYEIAVALSIMVHYYLSKDIKGLKKLVLFSFSCIIVTAIMSLYSSFIDPMYLRNLVGISAVEDQNKVNAILSLQKFGGGNYGFFSAIVCLIPILLYNIKYNDNAYLGKKTLFLILIVFLFSIISVQLFANIITAFVFLIIGFLAKKEIKISSMVFMAFFILILLIPVEFYSELFVSFANYFDKGSHLYQKLIDFSIFLNFSGTLESTGAGGRAARFPLLLDSFLYNPVIGGPEWNGHMFWMNKLAVFGLLGTLPFAWLIYTFIKENIRSFRNEFKIYFLLSTLSVILLGFLKALSGKELWYTFFVILPGLYHVCNGKFPSRILLSKSRSNVKV